MNSFQVLALVLGLLALTSASLYLPYRIEFSTTSGEMDAESQWRRQYVLVWNAPEPGYDSKAEAHILSTEIDVGRLLATYAIILPITILLFAAGYATGNLDKNGPALGA